TFEGLIRKDPIDKQEIVVANMSCNSSRTIGGRPEIIENLKFQNPDLLFFGGDQTYRHTEHTAGWIEFGLQFRDIIRDRPTICIPDDHDVGHGNVWGENGKKSTIPGDADGGYRYPVDYVNQVQRQQSWHLPDPVDPAPVDRGIGVYFTRMTLGGVDFAILEDRKFKTGPAGKIPKMGPRPDHINDPKYDPKTIDLPGLQLLGDRQEKFLQNWTEDWTGACMKAVLSQTAFCGAVHMHGGRNERLLADLDCNGWPQTPRNHSLELIRQAWAVHLCGDQHLAVVVKHGIKDFGDGPYGFTSPALVNTIYGRWWHPLDEKAGPNPVMGSPLPWTGDFKDGLGNRISMLAYANPEDISNDKKRADGYGLVRFDKKKRTITFECWPRFSDAKKGVDQQFAGWPITVAMDANDGRKVTGWLPE
ncbi:MAG: metallophosphoesterase family protein, partial [Planctomycetia bacterium]